MAQHLTVGSFSPSVLLDLARDTGRLDQHGLAVTETPVTSSPAQFQALVDGELDVALTSPDNVIAYRFSPRNPLGRFLDARIVSAVDRGLGLGLYAGPGVDADDLRGKRIGVDVATSGFALALYGLLARTGVQREEVELVDLGSTPRRREALLAGDCDATMLNAGNELVAEQAGCRLVASVPATLGPYLGTVLAVVGGSRLDEAQLLAAALVDTAHDVVSGRLEEQARSAAADRLSLDADLAQRYVDRLRSSDDGLVADGQVDGDALRTLVNLRRRFLPEPTPAGDALDSALEPGSGLLWPAAVR